MKNNLSISYLILITASLCFGCSKAIKQDNKNNAPASVVTTGEKYNIDTAESVVTWKGAMLVGTNSHTGFVKIAEGVLLIDNNRLAGGAAIVDMNTIEDETHSSDNNLIRHLKDPDFFDVEKFPTSTIAITGVESVNDIDKRVTGNLTIKGITHPVTFPAKVHVMNGIAKMDGKLGIDRTLWRIYYKSGKFYDLVADETMSDSITFNISVVAKKNLKAKTAK